MKHHPAPAPGGAYRAPVHEAAPPLWRRAAALLVFLAAPSYALAQVTVTATEGAEENSRGGSVFTVSLAEANAAVIDVQFSVAGTASAGEDYDTLPASVGIPAGETSAEVEVRPIDDDLVEGNETVVITLTGTSSSEVPVGSPSTATLTIADDDEDDDGDDGGAAEVVVSVTATDNSAAESPNDGGQFTVARVGGDLERAVTVNYSVSGSATAGDDYAALSGSVSLQAGVPEASIPVSVPGDDNIFEGDETVTVTLAAIQGEVSVADGPATVTIHDSTYTVTVSNGADAAEESSAAGRVDVVLSAANQSGGALNVSYTFTGSAAPGADYAAPSGTASIAAGESSASIAIAPVDDDEVEDEETVVITLTGTDTAAVSVGSPANATVTIADNDEEDDGGGGGSTEVQVSVVAADASAAETPGDPGQFVVKRVGGNADRAIEVAYSVSGSATPGDDYSALSGSVSLGAGQPEATVAVNVPGDDDALEGSENVTVTLRGVAGDVVIVEPSATVTIADSSYAVTASNAANADEDSGANGRIDVSLGARNASGANLTVSYSVGGSATPGTDYAALSGTATIPVGSSSTSITINPVADDLVEENETVIVTLTDTNNAGAPIGSPASASVSIASADVDNSDDDGDGLTNRQECPLIVVCIDSDEDGLTNDQDPDDDGDGVPTASEAAPDRDTDGDGTPDYVDTDDDGDGRPTLEEDANDDGDGNPATAPTDVDGDGIANYLDADDSGGPQGDVDGDGLTNDEEADLGTDPARADSDGDGVNDGSEASAGSDPLDNRSFADADGDLVPDAVEADDGTDPGDPNSFADGDGGGTADHVETITYATFGLPQTSIADASDDRRDLDGDGLPDPLEIGGGSNANDASSPTADGAGDENDNGITNAVEAYLETLGIASVEPLSDRDRDGYPDAAEVALGLNPLQASERDSDGDGVPNVVEALAGLDIDGTTDSDGDGVPDAREIALGSNTLDANSPVANGAADDDGDGVSNAIEEVLRRLGAEDVDGSSDGDGDGIVDADEIRFGTDPFHDEQPAPWIELTQAQIGSVNALLPDGDTATAIAFVGGHQAGDLVYDWSGSSNALLAVSTGGQSASTLTISPLTLPPGPYELVLTVQRRVGDYTSDVSTVKMVVNVLEGATAADVADVDGDGVPDTADDADARAGLGNELQVQSGARMLVPSGIRLQLGSTARTARTASALVSIEHIASAGDGAGGSVGNSQDEFDYVSGIYDFAITNLPDVGSAVQVVIPQAAAIGEFAEYRKFRPDGGWTDFVEDDNNSIASAAGAPGSCPAPGDASYEPGLAQGHFCIQLTIEDGGPNDGDAALGPNGVIEDPGGAATPKGQVTVGQGGGGFGPAALIVLGLGWIAMRCRRRIAGRRMAGHQRRTRPVSRCTKFEAS
ncbi:MAG TPA: Calx-beta domain-containing protein [Woeseiaceae bacterium]|nr:Calx-beta domain-containing protein [Woeseiaceae bacterium]